MTGLTPRQAAVLAFIEKRVAEQGSSPSYEEIAKHIGLASRSGAHRCVDQLIERGRLQNIPGRARTLSVADGKPALRDQLERALRRQASKQRTTPTALLNEIVADYLGISSDGGVIG